MKALLSRPCDGHFLPSLLFACSIVLTSLGGLHPFGVEGKEPESEQERRRERQISIEESHKRVEIEARDYAEVTYASVGSPINRFLLIRRDKDFCAIRFTAFHRSLVEKHLKLGFEDPYALYAEYEWYYQSDGSADVRKSTAKSGRTRIARIPIDISPEEFLRLDPNKAARRKPRLLANGQDAETKVRCGPFTLTWYYPTRVQFGSEANPRGEGVEMAPTPWRSPEEIDAKAPKLRWFKYDSSGRRPTTLIRDVDL